MKDTKIAPSVKFRVKDCFSFVPQLRNDVNARKYDEGISLKKHTRFNTGGKMKILLFVIISFFLFAFVSDNLLKSDYVIPIASSAVCIDDLDLDGDNDVIVGHIAHSYGDYTWGGVSILKNNGKGHLYKEDSLYVYGANTVLLTYDFNKNDYPDIVTQTYFTTNGAVNIIFDYNNIETYRDSLFVDQDHGGAEYIVHGDVDGNGWEDIIIASNWDRFWAITYNDSGRFEEPQYYFVGEPVVDIECADLNNDGYSEVMYTMADLTIKYYEYTQDTLYTVDTTINGEILLSDFNVDNYTDIILKINPPGMASTILIQYENNGDLTFTKHPHYIIPYTEAPLGWQVEDFNNDNLPDLVFTGSDYKNSTGEIFNRFYIYYNKGNFQLSGPDTLLTKAFVSTTTRIACKDMDGNGYNDIVLTRGYGLVIPNLTVLFNDGLGNFLDYPVDIKSPTMNEATANLNCYPNPFREQTTIHFELKQDATVYLFVTDITGRIISNIINNKKLNRGEYSYQWNVPGKNTSPYNQGFFIVHLEINKQTSQTFKLIQY